MFILIFNIENFPNEMVSLMLKSYIDFQESLRKVHFNNASEFLYALSYDAIFMDALENNNMKCLTKRDLNMSSFNYIISTSPEFFNIDGVMERAYYLLEQEKKHTKVFSKKKKNIASLKHSLDVINKKEE